MQFLYFLQKINPTSDGYLIREMRNWIGTGRYPTGELGSDQSQALIIENLLEMGLAVRTGEKGKLVGISEDGRSFLRALHPDCEDPDQVARLSEWCVLPWEEAAPKISTYIRTFFGKQLRYMSKRI